MIHKRFKSIALLVLTGFLNSEKVFGSEIGSLLNFSWEKIKYDASRLVNFQNSRGATLDGLILNTNEIANKILTDVSKFLGAREIDLWIDSLLEAGDVF